MLKITPKKGYFTKPLTKGERKARSPVDSAKLQSSFAHGANVSAKPGKLVDNPKEGGEAMKQQQYAPKTSKQWTRSAGLN